MNYASLSKTQKRAVDAFCMLDPSLRTASTITRKQVEALVPQVRANDPTFGYPAWIEKGTKVARATYVFPGPEAKTKASPNLKTVKSASDVEFEAEFEKEMSDSGII